MGRTYLFDLDGYQIFHPPDLGKLKALDPRLGELAERTRMKAERQWRDEGDEGEGEVEEGGYNAYCGESSHLPEGHNEGELECMVGPA